MQAGLPAGSACRVAVIEPLSDEPATRMALAEIIRAHFAD